jgi:hypothetical protein
MTLGKGIVVHVSEEALKNWEAKEKPTKRKSSCPSCEIQIKKNDYNREEIKDEVIGK